jgi:hypothetical protein
MSNFHVGQKVAATIDMPLPGIDKGDVFTIRAVEHGRYYGHDKAVVSVGLHFDEIETPSGCANFDARYFRPVVIRKTDISIFTAMLNTQRTGVPA